jgi:hypothetical protein
MPHTNISLAPARVQAEGARRQHQRLQEHAVVDQRAAAHDAVDGEHEADRRVEKAVVPLSLRMHLVLLAFADSKVTVQGPAVVTSPIDVRRDPLGRVVAVHLTVLGRQGGIGTGRIVRSTDLRHECIPTIALQYVHLPRLGVRAGRRAPRDPQDFFDLLARDRPVGRERAA